MAELESLQVDLERQFCEALKMKPKLCRKLQTIGDARQWDICLGGLKAWDEAGQPKAMNLGKGLLEIGVLVGICACDEDEKETRLNKG